MALPVGSFTLMTPYPNPRASREERRLSDFMGKPLVLHLFTG